MYVRRITRSSRLARSGRPTGSTRSAIEFLEERTFLSSSPTILSTTTQTALPIANYSAISNCRVENSTGPTDIGYDTPGNSSVDYLVSVAKAGTYTLTINTSDATVSGPITLKVNGSAQQSIVVPRTNNWSTHTTETSTLNLATGNSTISFVNAAPGMRYNLYSAMLSLIASGGQPSSTAAINTYGALHELDIAGTTSGDNIKITQSGSTITLHDNGGTKTYTGTINAIAIRGGAGDDTITVDPSVTLDTYIYSGDGNDTIINQTRGQATIVAIGGGKDVLKGNGVNTEFWADSSDSISANGSEHVHVVTSFYNSSSLALNGPNLADPVGTGSTTRLSGSFWGTGPVAADVNQGQLSDCYLLGALSSIASSKPITLRNLGVDLGDGTYAIQMINNGSTIYVRVDGDLPSTSNNNGSAYYAHPGSDGSLWAPLFEKAYALVVGKGKYASINDGWMTQAFSAFGIASNTYYSSSATALYSEVSNALAAHQAVTIGTLSTIVSGAPLIYYHVYNVIGVTNSNNNAIYTLENPWGFNGAGSNYWGSTLTVTASQLLANLSGTVIGRV